MAAVKIAKGLILKLRLIMTCLCQTLWDFEKITWAGYGVGRLVGLQVLELRKAKHCLAHVAACEAKASKAGSCRDWTEIKQLRSGKDRKGARHKM